MEAVSHSISKLFRSGQKRAKQSSSVAEELCRRFSLVEIKIATDNFDKDLIIGKGYFGTVYKGCIDDRTMNIAIKRLSSESRKGFDGFSTKVLLLCHPNIVHLIGYCIDEPEMIPVYEFIGNGNLCDHLYDTDHNPLPWKQRLQICIGVARRLHYLHTGVKHSIIHRNVKPTDILLDEKLEPKLSDFGYSKMGPSSLSNDLPMEEDEGRVEEKGRQNNENIQKINTFHKPSPLSSP